MIVNVGKDNMRICSICVSATESVPVGQKNSHFVLGSTKAWLMRHSGTLFL